MSDTLALIMERNAWRAAMIGLCVGSDKDVSTPELAAEHLRKRLAERAVDTNIQAALKDHASRLNRCAAIEQELIDIANGKRDLPTREECRELALRLGDPTYKPKTKA
jgi:hypothetical protein